MSKNLSYNEKVLDAITGLHITEKSTEASEFNKYVFQVKEDATKYQIKKAVSSIFNVEVTSVNTIKQKGKKKIFKGRLGKRPDFKKAIVSVKEGQNIDLTAKLSK